MNEKSRTETWNETFQSVDADKYYGSPMNPDVERFLSMLPPGAAVLDLGCGMGKTSVQLSRLGHIVTTVDFSDHAIRSLSRECEKRGLEIDARHLDVLDFEFEGPYDLIIAHGILQFLSRPDWERLISRMREHTRTGGINFVLVFSDAEPVPNDMLDIMGDVFREGELFELYSGWDILFWKTYVKEDEHPGGIRHRHPMNKIVAVKR